MDSTIQPSKISHLQDPEFFTLCSVLLLTATLFLLVAATTAWRRCKTKFVVPDGVSNKANMLKWFASSVFMVFHDASEWAYTPSMSTQLYVKGLKRFFVAFFWLFILLLTVGLINDGIQPIIPKVYLLSSIKELGILNWRSSKTDAILFQASTGFWAVVLFFLTFYRSQTMGLRFSQIPNIHAYLTCCTVLIQGLDMEVSLANIKEWLEMLNLHRSVLIVAMHQRNLELQILTAERSRQINIFCREARRRPIEVVYRAIELYRTKQITDLNGLPPEIARLVELYSNVVEYHCFVTSKRAEILRQSDNLFYGTSSAIVFSSPVEAAVAAKVLRMNFQSKKQPEMAQIMENSQQLPQYRKMNLPMIKGVKITHPAPVLFDMAYKQVNPALVIDDKRIYLIPESKFSLLYFILFVFISNLLFLVIPFTSIVYSQTIMKWERYTGEILINIVFPSIYTIITLDLIPRIIKKRFKNARFTNTLWISCQNGERLHFHFIIQMLMIAVILPVFLGIYLQKVFLNEQPCPEALALTAKFVQNITITSVIAVPLRLLYKIIKKSNIGHRIARSELYSHRIVFTLSIGIAFCSIRMYIVLYIMAMLWLESTACRIKERFWRTSDSKDSEDAKSICAIKQLPRFYFSVFMGLTVNLLVSIFIGLNQNRLENVVVAGSSLLIAFIVTRTLAFVALEKAVRPSRIPVPHVDIKNVVINSQIILQAPRKQKIGIERSNEVNADSMSDILKSRYQGLDGIVGPAPKAYDDSLIHGKLKPLMLPKQDGNWQNLQSIDL